MNADRALRYALQGLSQLFKRGVELQPHLLRIAWLERVDRAGQVSDGTPADGGENGQDHLTVFVGSARSDKTATQSVRGSRPETIFTSRSRRCLHGSCRGTPQNLHPIQAIFIEPALIFI
jgi:hypothetical protein